MQLPRQWIAAKFDITKITEQKIALVVPSTKGFSIHKWAGNDSFPKIPFRTFSDIIADCQLGEKPY